MGSTETEITIHKQIKNHLQIDFHKASFHHNHMRYQVIIKIHKLHQSIAPERRVMSNHDPAPTHKKRTRKFVINLRKYYIKNITA